MLKKRYPALNLDELLKNSLQAKIADKGAPNQRFYRRHRKHSKSLYLKKIKLIYLLARYVTCAVMALQRPITADHPP